MKFLFVLVSVFAVFCLASATKCYFCYGKRCDSLTEDRLKDCSLTIDYIQSVLEKLKIPKIPENILSDVKFECLSLDLTLDGQETKIKTCVPHTSDRNVCEILEIVSGKKNVKSCATCDKDGCNKS
ncbi:hypothetical protein ACFFRR_000186 [Megaselia abdita]